MSDGDDARIAREHDTASSLDGIRGREKAYDLSRELGQNPSLTLSALRRAPGCEPGLRSRGNWSRRPR